MIKKTQTTNYILSDFNTKIITTTTTTATTNNKNKIKLNPNNRNNLAAAAAAAAARTAATTKIGIKSKQFINFNIKNQDNDNSTTATESETGEAGIAAAAENNKHRTTIISSNNSSNNSCKTNSDSRRNSINQLINKKFLFQTQNKNDKKKKFFLITSKLDKTKINNNNNLNNNNNNNNNELVKAIFICEFHITAGRKIKVQVPENYFTEENFETVSRYIIPQVDLSRSFLSLSILGYKILGYPVRIDHSQYARNAFYFNVCFVFASTTRTVGYEPVVKKLSEYLLSMENSIRLLSQQSDSVQIGRLAKFLSQVKNDINTKKMCMLQEGSTLIPMCVTPTYYQCVKVSPHHAVVLTDNFYKYVSRQWDLTTLRILPYIDGFNHVAKITALADVALELVCDCVLHLIVLGVAVVVPVFQYSNVYRPTPKLPQLAKCYEFQRNCIQKCSKSMQQRAKVRDIFRIFASMTHGATFGELCVRFNPSALNINERKMVLFGQLEGLIRRVEKYPITVKRDLFADDDNNSSITTNRNLGLGQISNTTAFEQQQQQQTQAAEFSALNCSASSPIPSRIRGRTATTTTFPKFQQQQQQIKDCHYNQLNTLKFDRSLSSKLQQHYQIFNGLKSYDEICCATNISSQQLDYCLARDKNVIVLLK